MTKLTSFLISTLLFYSLSLDTSYKHGGKVVNTSYNNLYKLLFCDMNTFRSTMNYYDYTLSERKTYVANTSVGNPIYSIQKDVNSIVMINTTDTGQASTFRKEIRTLLKGGRPSYEGQFEVYYASCNNGGFSYDIKIAISESIYGSSTIGIVIL